jgi:CBS domain-containing protein
MTTIRDIMHKHVVQVHPETTLEEAARILTEQHVGGAPVVSANGSVIGMISELALIDIVFDADVGFAPVTRYMTHDVHAVAPDDSLTRAAQLFALYSFRRLPVVENGKLVGIVTRRDLINHSLNANELLREPLLDLIPALAPMS